MFNQSRSVKFCHMRMLYIPSEDAGYVRKGDEKDKEKIYIHIEANQFCFSLIDSNIHSNSSLFQNLLERLKQC